MPGPRLGGATHGPPHTPASHQALLSVMFCLMLSRSHNLFYLNQAAGARGSARDGKIAGPCGSPGCVRHAEVGVVF